MKILYYFTFLLDYGKKLRRLSNLKLVVSLWRFVESRPEDSYGCEPDDGVSG